MFNMRYHADERSMDMTRRRRWHRKMIPDRSNVDENLLRQATEGMLIDTDVVFRMQTTQPSSSSADPSSTTTNKDIKIELSAPRMFLSFKSKSSSFDDRRHPSFQKRTFTNCELTSIKLGIFSRWITTTSRVRDGAVLTLFEQLFRSVRPNWIHQSKSTDRSDSEDSVSNVG
jgi:hypothetical protein